MEVSAYLMPSVMLICCVFGFAVKTAVKNDRVHDFIPMMCAAMGTALAVAFAGATLDNIAAGAVSGIAATGLWEQFVHILPKE